MRIVLTSSFIEGAGITTFCENLAFGLNEAGHEVILLSGSSSRYPSQNYRPPKAYRKCVFLKRGISTAKSYLRRYIKVIKDLNPDVLLINNSSFVMASLPFIPWHIIRIPVIHSIREVEVRSFLALHFWWDRAICVGPLIGRVAKGLPGSAKLYVCPLGIKIDYAKSQNYRINNRNGPIYLMWAGRVHKVQKRADLIPQIAKELEIRNVAYRWTVLGDGKDLGTVLKALDKMGITNKFTFTGYVPRHRVLETFRKAHILVMPSDCEGLPQALLEAMSEGVVPVVSKIPGSTDYIIRDGEEGFLCERGNPISFANKILKLEQDRSLLSSMSDAAIRRVSSEFDHQSFAKRILQNISDAVEEGIARDTPYPMKMITAKIPEMKGRECKGLIWAIGTYIKYGILNSHRKNG